MNNKEEYTRCYVPELEDTGAPMKPKNCKIYHEDEGGEWESDSLKKTTQEKHSFQTKSNYHNLKKSKKRRLEDQRITKKKKNKSNEAITEEENPPAPPPIIGMMYLQEVQVQKRFTGEMEF